MNFKLNHAATAVLSVCLAASFGQASQAQSPLKKNAETNKVKAPVPPSIEAQIQELREELERQNNSLKTELAEKDAELRKAQQAAADAQAAAARAEAAVKAQQQAVTENATAVSTPREPKTQDAQTPNQLAHASKSRATGLSASMGAQSAPNPTEPGAPSLVEKSPVKTVLSAIAPIRALPVGGIGRDASVPAFKADGVGMTPYGFVKATAVEDSSSPNGDDFPLPGFLCDTGPDGAPEFHVKARGTRVGSNFTWYDPSSKWSITGKIEMDFEGNFNRSDNRNISSVRSSNPSLRLAWGRLDYSANDKNVFSALFGQDWTPFGSSTLPNILETTGLGIGFGTLYERTPQMRVGYTHKAAGFQIMPELALTMPAVGLTPSAANISQQLGYGERQGSDSNRPDIEGRIVGQWQLDHAPGVAPAQIILSGERGSRTAIVLAANIPTAYDKTFVTGATGSSHTDGWDFEWQLPSRYATLIGKFYSGSELRYFFAGQLYSVFNDTNGLTNLASVSSEDGSSTVVLGTNASGQQVIAPERPVRTDGGFAQLGVPLSRIFNARSGGRNAGWSLYGLYSIDQAKTRDLDRLGSSGNRRYSTMAVGTLNYGLNRWVSFSLEESLYTTHANPEEPLPLFKGTPSREWNDVRMEFGPVFNF
jgi:Skp family chaperone for outer membrane proteins